MSNKVVLITDFEFHDQELAKVLGDFVKVGEIYKAKVEKAVYEDTETEEELVFDEYTLVIEGLREATGVPAVLLRSTEGETNFYSYKLEEVTLDTMLDQDLTPAQMAKMAEWLGEEGKLEVEIENSTEEDIERATKLLGKYIILQDSETGFRFSGEELSIVAEEDVVQFEKECDFINDMEVISDKDPDFFNTLAGLLKYLAGTYNDKYEASAMGNPSLDIAYSETYGKGANMFNAVKYLQRYMTEGFAKSDNPKDVTKAIHYCLFELTRRHKNGLNEDGKDIVA